MSKKWVIYFIDESNIFSRYWEGSRVYTAKKGYMSTTGNVEPDDNRSIALTTGFVILTHLQLILNIKTFTLIWCLKTTQFFDVYVTVDYRLILYILYDYY